MEDETLSNVLNFLQNVTSNNSNNTNNSINNLFSNNNDIQTLLLKFLLSGGLNQIMNTNKKDTASKTEAHIPEKHRTIDLTNYQRLD